MEGPAPSFTLLETSDTAVAIKQLKDLTARIRARNHVQAPTKVLLLIIVNWCSPSLTTRDQMLLQQGLLGAMLNQQDEYDALGLVFTPVWERRKGMLYISENKVLEAVANANVNCDEKGYLSFEERADARDRRPLEYPIRLCLAQGGLNNKSCWAKVPLIVNNRTTARARMLATKDMLIMEDVADDAVPATSNLDAELNPADRYCQLGDHATAVVLDSTVRRLTSTERTAVLIVDIGPKTGDWARSVLCMDMAMPVHYAAVGDAAETEWTKQSLLDHGVERFLTGELKIPEWTPLAEHPDEGAFHEPAPPTLQVCGIDGSPKMIVLPDDRRWREHPTYGEKYMKVLEAFADITLELGDAVAVPRNTGKFEGEPPAKKRAKLEHALKEELTLQTVDIGDLGAATLIHDVPMLKPKPGLSLRVFVGNKVFLVNPTAELVRVDAGSLCAGFQKGKWWNPRKTEDIIDQDKDVRYNFSDAEEMVLLDKVYMSLEAVIQKQREVAPEKALVRYHRIVDEPTEVNPGFFKISAQHEVCWRLEPFTAEEGESGKKILQSHLASALPVQCWMSKILSVSWHVRWATAGLTGIRPVVLFKVPVSIPSGCALELTAVS